MKACNVLYQLHLYFFLFFGVIIPHSFQNSLKTRIDCAKLYNVQKLFAGVSGRKKGGRHENGGNSALVVGGIDAPENNYNSLLISIDLRFNAHNIISE